MSVNVVGISNSTPPQGQRWSKVYTNRSRRRSSMPLHDPRSTYLQFPAARNGPLITHRRPHRLLGPRGPPVTTTTWRSDTSQRRQCASQGGGPCRTWPRAVPPADRHCGSRPAPQRCRRRRAGGRPAPCLQPYRCVAARQAMMTPLFRADQQVGVRCENHGC